MEPLSIKRRMFGRIQEAEDPENILATLHDKQRVDIFTFW